MIVAPRLLILAAIPLLSACAAMQSSGPRAAAILESRSGSNVAGVVNFSVDGGKLRVAGRIVGLTPGAHGFHVHESGDCSAPDGSSAKGHFNPGGEMHGHHGGDIPNLVADSQGNADYDASVDRLTLDSGEFGVIGRSVVIHADPDDYQSQPAGNSGKRVACGTIRMS